MTKTILTIASALLLLAACGKKEAPQAEKATDNYLKRQPGDSTLDRKSTRLNSSHSRASRMPSSA